MIANSAISLLLQTPPANPGNMTSDQQFQIAMEAMRRGGIGFSSAILALLVPFAVCLVMGVVAWMWIRQRQAQMSIQAEVNKQLIEKFGSGRELTEFLDSRGGQRFIDAMWSQNRSSLDHILRMMRTGIVLTVVGLGMLVWAFSKGKIDHDEFLFPAVLLPLGLGFLISAAISYRLSKRWQRDAGSETPLVP